MDQAWPPKARTINFRGNLLHLERPRVMGILNLTPDSFSDGGRFNTMEAALKQTGTMLDEGADLIDIGAYSSRPGASDMPVQEELNRLSAITRAIREQYPDAILSVDTFRAEVARQMLDLGVHMINDISGGTLDPEMMPLVADYQVPYCIMHMRGTPQTMTQLAHYENVTEEVLDFLLERIGLARAAGIHDLIIDPGFGFAKRLSHNYELFRSFHKLNLAGVPMLIGISRKSMIYKLFGAAPDEVLDLSTALHLKALEMGADILRVHDVKPARRAVTMHQVLNLGVNPETLKP